MADFSITQYFKGTFITDTVGLKQKLKGIKAYVFDWDGVFNDGHKKADGGSSYSETDSMGVNLLRFNHHLLTNEMPITVLITGERNPTAFNYTKRERFDSVYFKIRHKEIAFKHVCEKYNLQPHEILFVFDDALDLSAAKLAGVRFMVNHSCNPLLIKFAIDNHLVDYLTFHDGASGAIRESSEVIIGFGGHFNSVVEHRMKFTATYQMYLKEKEAIETQYYTVANNEVIKQDI